jgi:Zn-finger nucleic acid-binding protein
MAYRSPAAPSSPAPPDSRFRTAAREIVTTGRGPFARAALALAAIPLAALALDLYAGFDVPRGALSALGVVASLYLAQGFRVMALRAARGDDVSAFDIAGRGSLLALTALRALALLLGLFRAPLRKDRRVHGDSRFAAEYLLDQYLGLRASIAASRALTADGGGARGQPVGPPCEAEAIDWEPLPPPLDPFAEFCARRVEHALRYLWRARGTLPPVPTFVWRPADETPSSFACPRCFAPVNRRPAGEIATYPCLACGGMWLPIATAADAFRSYDFNLAAAASQASQAGTAAPDLASPVPCPCCRTAMQRLRYEVGDAAGEIDACGAHGAWFDRHELDGILEAVARPSDRPQADTLPNTLFENLRNAAATAGETLQHAEVDVFVGGASISTTLSDD